MKGESKEKAKAKKKDEGKVSKTLRHDINNQLSNIFLAIEQLKYEIPELTEDCVFYLNSISVSTAKINSLLQNAD